MCRPYESLYSDETNYFQSIYLKKVRKFCRFANMIAISIENRVFGFRHLAELLIEFAQIHFGSIYHIQRQWMFGISIVVRDSSVCRMPSVYA